MSDASGFTKLVPGFEFMQSLVKNAGAALPGIGQWVAPTLNPEEIDKRIEELRTVQFWLEQNSRMLSATIQALEVQRMTLSTLQTMNVQMEGLRDSLQIKMPAMPSLTPAPAPAASAPAPAAWPAPATEAARAAETETETETDSGDAATPKPGLVDPMQWWSALTKQFTELATTAMKDTGTDAARSMAAAMVQRSLDGGDAAPAKAPGAVKPARKAAAKARPPAAKKAAARR